jgi:hypothetical protein
MRGMVSCFVVLIHLMRDAFGKSNEFFVIVVHPYVVLVSHLVANDIIDMMPSYIQVCTSCIFKFLILNGLLLLLKRLSLVWLLRS